MDQTLFDYFDRISIIHLPLRVDRLNALSRELARIGIDIDHAKVSIPKPPMPEKANGFTSRGVYGNFLSHLEIIEGAYRDGLETVLILEDDAIFCEVFNDVQSSIATHLRNNHWDEFFLGHSVVNGLPNSESRIVRFQGTFIWAHCYAVHRRLMPRIIEYFRKTINRDSRHPEGGQMYIDGAHNVFRRIYPDVICLLSSPCLSVQKGSPSSLAPPRWYDKSKPLQLAATAARNLRDECWRRGLINIGPRQDRWTAIRSAEPWPCEVTQQE